MPELPEVETTTRGIKQHLLGCTISKIDIRQPKLRWPIDLNQAQALCHQKITNIYRRAKYIILACDNATWALIHLGMSGSLRILNQPILPGKHDHFDIFCDNGKLLRYHDPRRFGCFLITQTEPASHRLLQKLGPEPLSRAWNSTYLAKKLRTRRSPIKSILMQQDIVVGIGNIYANEALYKAKIAPTKPGLELRKQDIAALILASKEILQQAIKAGGTTLQDFTKTDGKPGYFQQQLSVYGQTGKPCAQCENKIKKTLISQRSTFYCPVCQQ